MLTPQSQEPSQKPSEILIKPEIIFGHWVLLEMELEFGGRRREPEIRRLYDMKEVLYDQSWLAQSENVELYYMFRDLFLSQSDERRLLEQGLRYDITIIPPRALGREYVKTAGHYHPLVPGSAVSYPELYEVIEGEGVYLLQKEDGSDVVAVFASEGDKVLIPPGYGHITINRANRTLKMANFVARDFSSIYQPIREKGGGAFFCTAEGWIRNHRYPSAAGLRRVQAPDKSKLRRLGMPGGKEMYPLLREPGRLAFLVRPEEHMDVFLGMI
jgi:glucose-6-phosphate isomerase